MPGWFKFVCCGVTAAAAVGVQASSATLGHGLTLKEFRARIESSMRGDQRGQLHSCTEDQVVKEKSLRAFSCKVGRVGFMHGIMSSDRVMRDVTFTVLVGENVSHDVVLFQTIAKHATWAATGDWVTWAGPMISDIMNKASKQPTRLVAENRSGLAFSAVLDRSFGDSTIPTWSYSIELAPGK